VRGGGKGTAYGSGIRTGGNATFYGSGGGGAGTNVSSYDSAFKSANGGTGYSGVVYVLMPV